MVLAVEDGLRKVYSQQKDEIWIDIIGAIKKAIKMKQNLNPSECKALHDLKKDDSVMRLPAFIQWYWIKVITIEKLNYVVWSINLQKID